MTNLELSDFSQLIVKERAHKFAQMLLDGKTSMSQFNELVMNTIIEVAFIEGDDTGAPIGILSKRDINEC